MGITRLLLLGLIIWLIFFLIKRFKLAQAARITNQKKAKVTTVRQCAVCAVHVPENEAVLKGDLYYCSQAHADQKR